MSGSKLANDPYEDWERTLSAVSACSVLLSHVRERTDLTGLEADAGVRTGVRRLGGLPLSPRVI